MNFADFDKENFGLPESFDYTQKQINLDFKIPNLMANIEEAPINDPASFCSYLRTTDG